MLEKLEFSTILAIDPGPIISGYVEYDCVEQKPTTSGLMPNPKLRNLLKKSKFPAMVYEKLQGMGMMPSKETFTTCEEVGRMIECFNGEVIPLTRHQVKLLICGTMRAKDANIRAAIIDMYGGGKAEAIGNKKSQGPLYGVKSHAWQALALVKALERKTHDDRAAGNREAAGELAATGEGEGS
tara:strand:- start:7349 stop:7897 length:549 start_codon:yes stop_codon:yes gene_type:complete